MFLKLQSYKYNFELFGCITLFISIIHSASSLRLNLFKYENSTSQSSTYLTLYNSDLAIDGNIKTCSHAIKGDETHAWWKIDFERFLSVSTVTILFNTRSKLSREFDNFYVRVQRTFCNGLYNENVNRKEDLVEVDCLYAYGNFISIKKADANPIVMCEVEVDVDIESVNLAFKRPVTQIGSIFKETSDYSVDGSLLTCNVIKARDETPWWRVILDNSYFITNINTTPKYGVREKEELKVFVSNDQKNFEERLCATSNLEFLKCYKPLKGKYVTLKKIGGTTSNWLVICEVEIYSLFQLKVMDERRFYGCPDDYKCRENQCIPKSWLCDGFEDCPFGDDEDSNCVQKICGYGNFKCTQRNQCIDNKLVCDGTMDCADNSDEDDCFSLDITNNILSATFQGESNYRICSTSWTRTFSNFICNKYYNRYYIEDWIEFDAKVDKFIELNLTSVKSTFPQISYFQNSSCTDKTFITILCGAVRAAENTCGIRAFTDKDLSPYIIRGDEAKPGAWPWHAQLFIDNYYQCGGTILSDRFILTAAHCLSDVRWLSKVQVKVGTNYMDDARVQIYDVIQFSTHPYFDGMRDDIAVLRLETPIQFTDYIRPVCLPGRRYVYESMLKYKLCFVASIGSVVRAGILSNYLLQSRMTILNNSECLDYLSRTSNTSIEFVKKYFDVSKEFCGVALTDVNICQGDSGSPLVCKASNNLWTQVGITTSYFPGYSKNPCINNIFLTVDSYLDYIAQAMNTLSRI